MNFIGNFVALDFETTGLDKDQDRIVEVALCKYKDGVQESVWTSFLNPEQEMRDFIVKLTGIAVNELAQAPKFADQAQEILDFIGDLPLVAHNAQMDISFFNKELERSERPILTNVIFDTLALSRMTWWHAKNHRLENLAEELGLVVESAHRALPDAQRCAQLFLRAQKTISSMSNDVLGAMASLAQGTAWEVFFTGIEPSAPLLTGVSATPVVAEVDVENPHFDVLFGTESPLKEWVPNFEPRKGQINLAKATYNAFRDDGILCAEAGTGSGKTLAYLSAVFSWLRTKKGRILISTATKTLQEQLFSQEIPRLLALHGDQIKVAILKGKENYLCPLRLQHLLKNPLRTLSPDERVQLMALLPWASATETGDIAENSGFSATRQAFLWKRVNGDPRACQGKTCAEHCFAEKARQKALESQILLVNHALFLKDVAMDFGLLPTYERVIVDEAHRLEDNARQQFSKQIWFYRLRILIQHLQHPFDKNIGHLSSAVDLANEEQKFALETCKSELQELEKQLHRLFLKIGKNLRKRPKVSDKIRFQQGVALDFDVSAEPFLGALRSTQESLQKSLDVLGDAYAFLKAEIFAGIQNLREFESDALSLFAAEKSGMVQWVEEWANPHTLKLIASPLDSSEIFSQKLSKWVKSAVFVSATLSLKGKFDYFQEKMRFDLWKKHPINTLIQQSPFDLAAQRKIVLYKGFENPNDKVFNDQMADVLSKSILCKEASVLGLFTSISSMTQVSKRMAEVMSASERQLLCQHIDGNMDNLMEQFRRRKGSVLLGTQVLWEGVNFPGDQLEVLVIAKLPFPNPNDPIVTAKNDLYKSLGKNPFRDYLIPEAQMQLRQGLGRLIRTPDDKGLVILFDPRLTDGNYSKSFTALWNHDHQVVQNVDELIQIWQDF